MEIRRWRFAVTLSQELHFGRAARRHFLAESHFGREIRKLESEIGQTLFERTSRRVRLTPAGSALIDEAVTVIEAFDHLSTRRRPDHEPAGTIRMGVLGFGLADLWDQYHLGVSTAHPDLRIQFVELDMRDQYRAVLTGRVDVAVVQRFGPVQGLDLVTVFRTPSVAVVRSDSPWAEATHLTDADFQGASWLPVADARFTAWAGRDHAENTALTPAVHSPSAIPAAVAATGLPSLHAAPAQWFYPHPGVRFRPIDGPTCDVAIATRAGDDRELVDTFRRVARDLAPAHTKITTA
ncbi:LysR family transcriptional regulator [Pseudonocardia spinosispora]|uniref:LysR family transcriptional regulator n=1 Tax=Pseudonocardia spinosispora TaxID=103441 RepID=UPI000417B080|nr:LysR family transcriptional regulator [Pseudonocardia spinosispora]